MKPKSHQAAFGVLVQYLRIFGRESNWALTNQTKKSLFKFASPQNLWIIDTEPESHQISEERHPNLTSSSSGPGDQPTQRVRFPSFLDNPEGGGGSDGQTWPSC